MYSLPLPETILQAIRNERSRVVAEREVAIQAAAAPFDIKIAELDCFLNGMYPSPPPSPPVELDSPADLSVSAKIKDAARLMIRPGTYVTTQQIYDALVLNGVEFPQTGREPLPRITKILSGTGLYRGNKTKGWSLKSEAMAALQGMRVGAVGLGADDDGTGVMTDLDATAQRDAAKQADEKGDPHVGTVETAT